MIVRSNISIRYVVRTIWGVCVSGIYMLRLDISWQHLEDDCKLKWFLCALRAQSWEVYISIKYPVVLDIGCQQFGEYNSVGYIC